MTPLLEQNFCGNPESVSPIPLKRVQPKTYSQKEHGIHEDRIDPDALFVLSKLQEAGFTAYLVGGSVRDLLLDRWPKDFDISTSARPEQIKRIFRNCLLIGKRFPLAHVRFGKKVIEVSTFRAGQPSEDQLITRDAEWGTPEQDVLRRDFTMNGLFYDPIHHTVIDYVGGFKDVHQHLLQAIGLPEVRFRQDPVRMLRLLKFRARFGFEIEPTMHRAMFACREEILKSSPARILEQMFVMLESGAAEAFFHELQYYGLLPLLYPELAQRLEGSHNESVYAFLRAIDRLHAQNNGAKLARSVLAAGLLYPLVDAEAAKIATRHGYDLKLSDVQQIGSELLKRIWRDSFPGLPRRLFSEVEFTLLGQYRLIAVGHHPRRRGRLVHHPGFADILQLLELRSEVHAALKPQFLAWKKAWSQRQTSAET